MKPDSEFHWADSLHIATSKHFTRPVWFISWKLPPQPRAVLLVFYDAIQRWDSTMKPKAEIEGWGSMMRFNDDIQWWISLIFGDLQCNDSERWSHETSKRTNKINKTPSRTLLSPALPMLTEFPDNNWKGIAERKSPNRHTSSTAFGLRSVDRDNAQEP